MRLRRLELLRYGHLADVALDFPEGALLHVVLGANEAGKSTALAAIGDALFGFLHHSEYDFLHGGPNLRIGFTLQATDGTTARYIRRKGRRDTLLDDQGGVVPEAALQPFLRGATRELFEQAFGLNAARLREGGTELLRSGGETGESLLAGLGLLNVRKAVERLDNEAKTLVGDGRGRRRLAEAVETWREAQRQSEECGILPRDWEAAIRAEAEVRTALVEVQEQTRQLQAESSRLHRVRRIAGILAQLDDARGRLTALADAPMLPQDTKQRMIELVRARDESARDLTRENAELERLQHELAGVPHDDAVLTVQDAIDALAERRATIIQAESDLFTISALAAERRAKIAAAIEELDLELSVEDACKRLPGLGARRAVQRLIKENAACIAALKTSQRSRDTACRKRDETAGKLQGAGQPASSRALRQIIEEIKSEGRIELELTKVERERVVAEHERDITFSALPLWRSDLAGLIALPLPLEGDEGAAAQCLIEPGTTLVEARERAGRLTTELSDLEEQIARLARGETIPTPDAVAGARALRDRAWRLIRHGLEGGTEPAAEELVGLPAGKLTDGFEILRDDADRMADRRADDAQRVSDYLGFVERSKLLRERLLTATSAAVAGKAALKAAKAEWLRLWEPCGFTPGTPEAMQQWRRDRAEIIRRSAVAEDARRRCEDLASRRDSARKALAEPVPPTAVDETLAALLRRAEQQCAALEQAEAECRQLTQSAAREAERLKESEQDVAAAEAALQEWQATWGPAITALGLPPEAPVDAAQAALEAWGQIAELAPAWQSDEERIAQMRGAIERFAAEAAKVEEALAERSDDPPIAVLTRLTRRLAEARDASRTAEGLRELIRKHEAARTEAERAAAEAAKKLSEMRCLAGANSDAELEQAIERALSRGAVADEATRLERQLLEQGDGHDEIALRAEAAVTQIDLAAARIDETERELQVLAEKRDRLNEERIRTEDRIADMRRGRDAAAHAQRAADALAEAIAAAERYARLHVARVLLRAGIERFRTEQQDPMLRRAGAYFALLTDGRYVRLGADQDQAGRTVLLAVRDDGTE